MRDLVATIVGQARFILLCTPTTVYSCIRHVLWCGVEKLHSIDSCWDKARPLA